MSAAPIPGDAELTLLLAGAGNQGDTAGAVRLRAALDARLDWSRVFELAVWHGLVPLTWNSLATGTRMPTATRALLKVESLRIARRNEELAAELARLAEALRARGVQMLAYKGPALAVMAYGSVALRPFGDLDIIVPRSKIRPARDLLVSEGYRPELALSARQEAAHFRTGYDLAFSRDRDRTVVELHWAVAPRYFGVPFDFATVHDRAAHVALAGTTVPTLGPEDLLPLLCVHGARHLWGRLEWVAAVAGVVRRHPDLDWPRVVAQATRDGLERLLLVGLALADGLFGLTLPGLVRARADRHPRLGSLVATFHARLVRGERTLPGVWETARLHLALRERVRDRIRHGWGGAFDPSERDRTGWLPAALGPLRPLARPFRLLRDYGLRRLGA